MPLRGHVWMATSGTSGALKLAALSKEALLARPPRSIATSARRRGDVWCCVLPTFHVGGARHLRARVPDRRARVVQLAWDAKRVRGVCGGR